MFAKHRARELQQQRSRVVTLERSAVLTRTIFVNVDFIFAGAWRGGRPFQTLVIKAAEAWSRSREAQC